MITYEASATIRAPVEPVWLRLSDVLHWNRWTPTVTRIEALDAPELEPGRRFLVHQPKLRPAIWRVTRVDAGSSFSWESRAPGVVMLAGHSVESLPSGDTRLELRFSFGGLLGPIVGRLNRRIVESYIATEAASLCRSVEADAASAPLGPRITP
jgi:hypothetical protein